MKWKNENNCLSDEILQKYVDEELTPEQLIKVKMHLQTCESCKTSIEEKKSLISELNEALELVEDEEIQIPVFEYKNIESIYFWKNRQVVWWSAAAVFLIVISVLVFNKTEKPDMNLEYVYREMQTEIDANKPWQEQTSTIYILNESGEIIDKIENL